MAMSCFVSDVHCVYLQPVYNLIYLRYPKSLGGGMVDAPDSKSGNGNIVRVRVPSQVHQKTIYFNNIINNP